MDYIDIVIACVTNGIRLWIIWHFMHTFFDVKDGREREELIDYILFYLINTIFFIWLHIPVFNVITNIIGYCLITYEYVGTKGKKVMISAVTYALSVACELVSVYMFIDYVAGEITSQTFNFVTILLFFFSELLVEYKFQEDGKNQEGIYVWGLIIIPIISIFMAYTFIIANMHNRKLLMIQGLGLLIINCVVFAIYRILLNTYKKIRKQDLQMQQAEIYQHQIELMAETEQKVRSLRHDMKEHMKELYCLAKADEAEDILEYLKGMYGFMDNPRVFVDSGNKEIDAILNYALAKAEEDLLQIDVNIKIPEGLQLDIFNMNVIIGNLLDNAVTASKTSEKKELKVDINYEKGILYLMIKNTYHGEIKKKGDKFLSNKQEDGHGIGLENVRNMVESMHGTLDIEYTKDEFKVNVMVYQP